MTTIAWDGHVLAADSLQTSNGVALWSGKKLARLKDGELVGTAGVSGYRKQFIAWYEAGADQKDRPDFSGGFAAIVITKDGHAVKYEEELSPIEVPEGEKVAIGSGYLWALAAMDHGKSSVLAVEYACKRDLNSGGKVNHLRLELDEIR